MSFLDTFTLPQIANNPISIDNDGSFVILGSTNSSRRIFNEFLRNNISTIGDGKLIIREGLVSLNYSLKNGLSINLSNQQIVFDIIGQQTKITIELRDEDGNFSSAAKISSDTLIFIPSDFSGIDLSQIEEIDISIRNSNNRSISTILGPIKLIPIGGSGGTINKCGY